VSDKLTREIKIKLSVDGKEVTSTLQIADDKMKQLVENYIKFQQQSGKPILTVSLDAFKNELLETYASTEELTESIADFIRMNGLSENQISDVINSLKQEKAMLGVNTAEYIKHNEAIENLSNAYAKVRTGSGALTNTMKGTSSGVQAMSQTMGQLGWAIGDADMFLVNFRMGMMSIGNNIPMIAQGFGYVRDKIKDTGETMKDVLIGAIKGPGGVMIAINGLMFLINALAFLWDKQKKQIKENAEEVKNLANEYENLSTVQLNRKRLELEVEKQSLELERDNLIETKIASRFDVKAQKTIEYEYRTVIDEDKYNELEKSIEDIDKKLTSLSGVSEQTRSKIQLIMEGSYNLNSINNVKEAIRLLNIELDNASSQVQRDIYNQKIKELEELIKQYRNEVAKSKISKSSNSFQVDYSVQNEIDISRPDKIKIPVELQPVDVEGNATPDDPWKPFEDTAWATAQNTAIQSIGQSIHNYIGRAFRKVIGDADNLFTNLIADVASALASLFTQQTALGIFNLVSGGSGGFMAGFLNIAGKAEGGMIDGPGTETSDSILARLSKGEFVVKAKATKAFLPILEAINNYDKTNVRPLFQKFANGGLVGRSAQLISSLAGASSVNVNLTMNPVELKQSGYDMRGVLKLIDRKEKKYR